jgi:hypothetical protein
VLFGRGSKREKFKMEIKPELALFKQELCALFW